MRIKRTFYFLTATLALLFFALSAQGKGRPFITRWKGEAGKELKIPIFGNNYKLVIRKANGTVLKSVSSLSNGYVYTPTEDGDLLVEAGPEGVECIYFYREKEAKSLLKVEKFGTVVWEKMNAAFRYCSNMKFAKGIDTPDLSQVTNMSYMFSGCTSFNQPLNNWNVSNVTEMENMFSGCTSFNQPLNNWDVSKVTDMEAMFCYCTSFNQPLNNWNVSNVKYMSSMFLGCTSFNQDLGTWKLEKCYRLGLDDCGMSVENFSKSLVGWAAQANIRRELVLTIEKLKCNASGEAARKHLEEKKDWVILSAFITRWKGEVGKELHIPINSNSNNDNRYVIKRATDKKILRIGYSKDIYSYTPAENGELQVAAYLEKGSTIQMSEGSAEALLRIEKFGTFKWGTMLEAFAGCKNLQFAEGIDTPDLSQVTNMEYIFSGCTSFNQSLANWNVSKVRYMAHMFDGCTSFNQPLNNWDVRNVWNMEGMFNGCTSFNQDLGMWKLERCSGLGLVDCGMSAENFSKSFVGWAAQAKIKQGLVLTLDKLRCNASGEAALKQLKEKKQWKVLLPFITRWKGEAGKELKIPIFGNNYKLVIKKASDKTVIKTVASITVTANDNYFYKFTPTEDGELLVEAGPEGVSYIEFVDNDTKRGSAEKLLKVEAFGTVNWKYMDGAFKYCTNMQFAKGIDTPDLSQVTDMSYMFYGCTSFNQPLNNWNVSNVQNMSDMFSGCSAFNQDLGMWKLEKCERLGFDYCGMSAENFSKSFVGWAAQTNIKKGVVLSLEKLKCNASGEAALKQLKEKKQWKVLLPFITRWKGEAGKELKIPIMNENGIANKLVIKRATDEKILKTEYSSNRGYAYTYTPTEDGEFLVETYLAAGGYIQMYYGSTEALLRVEKFGTFEWGSMNSAFSGCKKLQFAADIDSPDLSQCPDMRYMFSNCTSFNLPLNNWDVSNVKNMEGLFNHCTAFNQPLNNWNVSNVQNMSDMFSGCSAFNQDLGMWKLEKCERLGFDYCGMSAENFSKSFVGWAAQTNIKKGVVLSLEKLKCNASGEAALKQLKEKKQWEVLLPFITRWKGEAGKALRIPIKNKDRYNKLLIKRAIDEKILEIGYSKVLVSGKLF